MTARNDGMCEESLLAAADPLLDPQALLEAVRDGDGRIVDFIYREVNSAACTYLGSSRAELLGETLVQTLPGIVESGLLTGWAQCVETGEPFSIEEFPFPARGDHGVRRLDLQATRSNLKSLSLVWRDVTERLEIRQKLAASEEHFRLLLENSSDVVVQLRDDRIVWISPSVEAALGAPPSYWIGRDVPGLLATEDRQVFGNMVVETMGGASCVCRLRVRDAQGALRWVEVHAKTFLDAHGNPDGHAASLRVVDGEVAFEQQTERLRQERAQADARYRNLIENSIVATSLTDLNGRFVMVNPAICDWLGYDSDTFLTKTWQEITAVVHRWSPADAGVTEVSVDQAVRGSAGAEDIVELQRFRDLLTGRMTTFQGELGFIHADGRLLWGHVSAFGLRNAAGELEYLVGQMIDITEQAELRKAKSHADARFRRLIDNSSIGTALNTPDGRFALVNQALCDLLGYDADTLQTKTWQDLTAEGQFRVDAENIEALVAGRVGTYRVTKEFIHADGHLIWVDVSVSCLRDADGAVEYLVAQGVDISDEVAARELLAQRERENRVLAERLRAEIRNAAEYVESILPGDLHGPVEVSSRYLPSLDLGGDGFHYRWLDDDHLKVYLIDVSGHGIRPALLSVSVHNLIRSGSLPTSILLDPAGVLDKLNGLFQMDDQGDSYFTIWYGVYQRSTRTLRYASAGHPPALVLDRGADGGVGVVNLSTAAKPIGMFRDSVYECDSYRVPPGGQLLLYSDGAFELPAEGPEGRPWSRADFVDLCAELAARPGWSLDELVDRLTALSPTGAFDDDCALVLLTFP